jgi:hypothetical protein
MRSAVLTKASASKPIPIVPRREPNGKLQRAPKEEREADIIAVALNNPQRRGSRDDRRRWAIGRLILDGKVVRNDITPGILEYAAELYSKQYSQLQWLIDSRRPLAKGQFRNVPEPTVEDRDRIERAWADTKRAVRDAERAASMPLGDALVKAILDNPEHEDDLARWIILSLPAALAALVRHYELQR